MLPIPALIILAFFAWILHDFKIASRRAIEQEKRNNEIEEYENFYRE